MLNLAKFEGVKYLDNDKLHQILLEQAKNDKVTADLSKAIYEAVT